MVDRQLQGDPMRNWWDEIVEIRQELREIEQRENQQRENQQEENTRENDSVNDSDDSDVTSNELTGSENEPQSESESMG